jgi:hypothetical protein
MLNAYRIVRRDRALELPKLADVAGRDELAKPGLDAGADPAQLAHPAGPNELRHRDVQPPDQLCGPPERAHAERPRLGEVEEPGKRLEPCGDAPVVELLVDRAVSVPVRQWCLLSAHR